ncbi:uncharacterized protein LOC121421645 [Lytechinus variegatus]|uniref:uncharacterized protein LOC121421645 n=1 Tax=Lytechinus variegatus TaxID=7654 RepID=UPI001BB13720|nr:uncharacterized protein LOC121421645 [Lytechinus variegatus]
MASANDYKITREEALSFLQDVLNLESALSKLKTDKIAFLNEFFKAFSHHVPYQTVKALSTPPDARSLPTSADIKKSVTSKEGGLCYQLNLFAWMLLCALEFEAHLVSGDCLVYTDIHVVVIIDNILKKGSRHIFDVGMGFPILRLVPLDFEHQSPVYTDSNTRYRFVRQGHVIIYQLCKETHQSEAISHREYIQDGWISFIRIHVDQSVPVSHFDNRMTKVFTEIDPDLYFLTSLRCLAFPNGRLVCIKDVKLLLEDEDRQVQVTRFRSRDEVLDAFSRHFPQFPSVMVNGAMDNVNMQFNSK